jgi:predicted acylesterase/phospholipase RssA
VDGGYVNNMPVDVARQLGVESVIVVDVEDKETGELRGVA